MFREFTRVKQEPGDGYRRWFEADGVELIVWFDARDRSQGFQVCYDLGTGPHTLTWRPGQDLQHHRVDEGDDGALGKMTPVLEAAGAAPYGQVLALFDRHAGSLDSELRTWVRQRLATRTP